MSKARGNFTSNQFNETPYKREGTDRNCIILHPKDVQVKVLRKPAIIARPRKINRHNPISTHTTERSNRAQRGELHFVFRHEIHTHIIHDVARVVQSRVVTEGERERESDESRVLRRDEKALPIERRGRRAQEERERSGRLYRNGALSGHLF